MRACVHHDGALGDALLSLACLRGIASSSGIPDWIGRSDVGALLASLGAVRAAHDAGSSRFAQWYLPDPDRGAPDLLDRYDRVFLFTVRRGSDLERNVKSRVPDTHIVVTVPPHGERTHVAEFRMRQLPPALRYAGSGGLTVPSALAVQAEELLARAGHRGHGPVAILHPGSGGKRKCWPLERYFALADRLGSRTGAFVLFLSGPVEAGGMASRIEGFVQDRERMGCVAGRELPAVAAILARSAAFIGNDSGITHLAAAAGAPVVALFGPTDPARWAPRGAQVQVIASAELADIPVEAVCDSAEASLRQAAPFGHSSSHPCP